VGDKEGATKCGHNHRGLAGRRDSAKSTKVGKKRRDTEPKGNWKAENTSMTLPTGRPNQSFPLRTTTEKGDVRSVGTANPKISVSWGSTKKKRMSGKKPGPGVRRERGNTNDFSLTSRVTQQRKQGEGNKSEKNGACKKGGLRGGNKAKKEATTAPCRERVA